MLRGMLAPTGILLLLSLAVYSVAYARGPNQGMLVGTCVICHGSSGASMGPASPNLGGMGKRYFVASMLAFKHGEDEDALALSMKELAGLDGKEAYQDMRVYPRSSTIMKQLADGYTLEEILKMADYFSKTDITFPKETFNPKMAETGRKIHLQSCAGCHGDQGTFNRNGIPILGGQWKKYLRYTFRDYLDGSRKMPKTMQEKFAQVQAEHGDEGFSQLIHFYASVKTEKK